MLKKIFLAGTILALTAMPCLAQFPNDTYGGGKGKADATFSLCDRCINHHHVAWLGGGNSLTIDLYRHSGYSLIPDLEAILAGVSRDISFVADSVRECPQCSYRIDYQQSPGGLISYRMRKYPPQGTFLYQKTGDELKPFKPEPDTLRIMIRGALRTNEAAEVCQVTLILNRLANLDSLLAQKGKLNVAVDTMRRRSEPKTRVAKSGATFYSTTIMMSKNYRDTGRTNLYFKRGISRDGQEDFSSHSAFDILVNFGAGFLRDRFVPVAEGGIVYRLPGTRGDNIGEFLIGVYGSGYFAFAKGSDGRYAVQDNWFANVEFGGESDNDDNLYALKLRRITLGAGYLVRQKGDYFNGTTMKLFANFRLKNGITLSPEIIATDNFHHVFPGITLKVF